MTNIIRVNKDELLENVAQGVYETSPQIVYGDVIPEREPWDALSPERRQRYYGRARLLLSPVIIWEILQA